MPTRPPRVSPRLLAAALVAVAGAACGGSASTADAPTQDPTSAPSAAAVQPRAAPTMPPEPTTARPEPTPVTFSSPAYRYLVTFPSGLLAQDPVAVGEPWDGTARIDGFGLVVNLMSPPGNPDADRALLGELLASMQWRS